MGKVKAIKPYKRKGERVPVKRNMLRPEYKYIAVCPECGEGRIYSEGKPKYTDWKYPSSMSCVKDNVPFQEYIIFKRVGKIKKEMG